MLRGGSWFLGFLVSEFLVSWFQRFLVSWLIDFLFFGFLFPSFKEYRFLGLKLSCFFKVSKIQKLF